MADSKISALTSYTQMISTDEIPVVDITNSQTKQITWANFFKNAVMVAPTLGAAIATSIAAAANSSLQILSGTYQSIQTYSPGAGGTATLDLSKGNIHHVTMPAGNVTIALTNASIGQCFMVRILQDATGSRTVTWFTTIKWAGGSAPTLTLVANKADTIGFEITGSNTYDGFVVAQNI